MKRCEKCLTCGGSMQALEGSYHYLESGLPNVFLEGVPQLHCEECDDVLVKIPDVTGLHREIGNHLVQLGGKLTPEEFRFLRKSGRMTQEDMAVEMEVARSTINRWETGKKEWNRGEDLLVRVVWIQQAYGLLDELSELKDILLNVVRTQRRAEVREDIHIDLRDLKSAA